MSDMISREAAIDALKNAEKYAFNSYYDGLITAHRIIAGLPSAEPKYGKWIDTGKTELNLEDDAELRIFRCSECGMEVSAEKYPHETAFYLTKFCSECGADMRK